MKFNDYWNLWTAALAIAESLIAMVFFYIIFKIFMQL